MSKPEKRAQGVAGYVESYVRLEAASTEKKFRQGYRTTRWSDQFGEDCGTVIIENFSDNQCDVRYNLYDHGSSTLAQGRQDLKVEWICTNPQYDKPYFVCPACAARMSQLLFAQDAWACRHCHGLKHRSQYMSPLTRAWARFDELSRLLQPQVYKGARPRFMRENRFSALLAEYEALRGELVGQSRSRPHHGLSHQLNLHWERGPA